MATIQFSQNLVKYLPVYLHTSLGEIAKAEDFPYSKIYLYKIADGTAPMTPAVNSAFNVYWNKMGMTSDDLENLYNLIDLLEAGKTKDQQFKLKEQKEKESRKQNEN